MKHIGNKIREIRKKKGLSQEELADRAKVNLRTIQRIENDQNQPHGKTMQLICEVLEVNVEDILDYGKREDRKYLSYFHLSVLAFMAIPTANIFLPLALWLTKKDEIIGLKQLGKNVLNFQIIWTILTFPLLSAFAFFRIFDHPFAIGIILVWVLLNLLNMIFPIVLAIRVKRGKSSYSYPTLIPFIK